MEKVTFLVQKHKSCTRHRNLCPGPSYVECLEYVFFLRAGLWVAACARCLRWGARCAKFARLDSCPRFDSFPHVFSEFEMTVPSSPTGTVRRCCCASTMFLKGSYAGCLPKTTAQKTPRAPRPTHAAGDLCCNVAHSRLRQKK